MFIPKIKIKWTCKIIEIPAGSGHGVSIILEKFLNINKSDSGKYIKFFK